MSGGGKKEKCGIAVAVALVVCVLLILVVAGWVYEGRAREVGILAPATPVGAGRVGGDASLTFSNVVLPPVPTAESTVGLGECGLPKMPPDTPDADESDQPGIAASSKAHNRWEAALLDSSDPRARAIGLVIHRAELIRAGSAVQAEESRDELVQLAAGAGDPAVYAIAIGLCNTKLSDPVAAGACQRISLSEWTRVDPDNAVPWLATAQEARRKGEPQAEAAAFARAADAHEINNVSDSLLSFGLSELPREITPAEKMAIGIELIGYEAAWAGPELTEIMRFCSVETLRQDDAHKECAAVAELLVNHGGTIINLAVGARLGEHVGWSAERLQGISQERVTLFQLLPDEQHGGSCETVYRMNEFIDKRARLGELGALRDIRDQRDHTEAVTTTAGSTTTSSQFSSDPPRSTTRK